MASPLLCAVCNSIFDPDSYEWWQDWHSKHNVEKREGPKGSTDRNFHQPFLSPAPPLQAKAFTLQLHRAAGYVFDLPQTAKVVVPTGYFSNQAANTLSRKLWSKAGNCSHLILSHSPTTKPQSMSTRLSIGLSRTSLVRSPSFGRGLDPPPCSN